MNRTKWMVQNKSGDFLGISEKYHIDKVTARLLRNRDVITDEQIEQFLYGDITKLHDGATMKDMKVGTAIIKEKIKQQKKIRIIGDYDIDGVTATYILYQGITSCGGQVTQSIPDRITDGYGLNVRLIEQAAEDGVDTIITCDNGIAAMEAIHQGKELGLTIVVTDHHNIPYEMDEENNPCYLRSEADAVIDPKQMDCAYPFKEICGAVVAFKFILQLCKECGMPEDEQEQLRAHLIMFAAIGTVGDIMDLTDENRIIVKEGLNLLRQTKDESICALIRACNIEQKNLSAYHIGYILGPCINASGRLKTAEDALQLFLTKDQEECKRLAEELVKLNEERKLLTEQFTGQAIEMVEQTELGRDKVLVIFLPDCHESIAGIIAGRVKERFLKPTFVVTRTVEGLKGSGRSIDAYPMYDAMNRVADCFTKFGGHAMAAGFSLKESKLPELRRRLNEDCSLTEEDLVEKISIDVPMPMDYVNMKLIQEFEMLRPFGKGNPAPLFAQKDVELVSVRIIGRDRKFVKMKLKTNIGNYYDGIYFVSPEEFSAFLTEKFDGHTAEDVLKGKQTGIKLSVCYVPEINEYGNNRSIQIQVKYVS